MSKNAVIYARYSSSNQREESIDGQIRECRAFAETNGYAIVNIYIDRALSARTDNRPEFLRMVQDSQQKSFEAVIVYQLDRFSRNRYDSAVYKARLKKNGVRVLSAKERISDDPASIVLESVLEGMAEYYSAELSQKVYRGLTENVLKGKWPGGVVPLGYKLTAAKTLEIDELGAKAVRTAFEMYIAGHKISAIISHLNQKGYRTRTNKTFSRTSLNLMLRNKKYIGTMTWRDMEIENALPVIIDKKTFYTAQEAIKMRKRDHNTQSDTYPLVGKLTCGCCGGNMVGTCGTSKTGATYYYYKCYNKHIKKNSCTLKNFRCDKLEKVVLEHTIQMLETEGLIDEIARQAVAANKPVESIEEKSLKAKIRDRKQKIQNYINAIESGIISETITKNMAVYEKELVQLEASLEREKILSRPFELTVDHVKFFLHSLLKMDRKSAGFVNTFFCTFINQVIVHPEFIEVRYNYKNTPSQPNNVQEIRGSFLQSMAED